MKVLSIDLDYIMGPSIEEYENYCWNDCTNWRWDDFFENYEVKETDLIIDKHNLLFCYRLFLNSVKNSDCKVTFAYDHDNILFELQHHDNIDLINIDHHHDILYHDAENGADNSEPSEDEILESFEKKYKAICDYSMIDEGNWIAWLESKNKLNSYTWIANDNSYGIEESTELNYYKNLLPKFNIKKKKNFKFKDYKFDYIFVCLSPQYIPKIHWHYFSMFIEAYKQITGNEVNLSDITSKKYETFIRHSAVTDEILY
jgi:hypothetical protein